MMMASGRWCKAENMSELGKERSSDEDETTRRRWIHLYGRAIEPDVADYHAGQAGKEHDAEALLHSVCRELFELYPFAVGPSAIAEYPDDGSATGNVAALLRFWGVKINRMGPTTEPEKAKHQCNWAVELESTARTDEVLRAMRYNGRWERGPNLVFSNYDD